MALQLNIRRCNRGSRDSEHYGLSVPVGTRSGRGRGSSTVSIPVSDNSVTHFRPHLPTNCVMQRGKYGNRMVVSTTIQLLASPGSWPVITHNKPQLTDCEHSVTTHNAANRPHLQMLRTLTLISSLLQCVWHTWTSTTSTTSTTRVFKKHSNPTEQAQGPVFSTALTSLHFTTPALASYSSAFFWKINRHNWRADALMMIYPGNPKNKHCILKFPQCSRMAFSFIR